MEFLFENPFLLVILIGLISSIFKRMKGTQEEPRKSQPKPFVESGPFDFEQQPRQEQPVQRMEPVPQQTYEPNPLGKIEQEFLEKKKKAEEKLAALKKQQATAQKKAETIQSHRRLNQVKEKIETTEPEQVHVDNQKLVDAVIWSEILGPPRSKRPHSANRVGRY
ncbi:hypothetical protein ACFYKX_21770 [Cytobacillus sp. FJAT-54145]|uniref:Uncharacterized protein n=1 Tax=Cytobacillus spartinae TaxID=3299023 RepID=A0ABW6KGC3_9BACI